MVIKRYLVICSAVLIMCGCEAFEYHPYDGRVTGQTEVNSTNIARIEDRCAGKSSIRFVWMGDTQGWYDETDDFVKAVNRRGDIDFVMHGGDVADFGMTKEFLWMRDIMNKLSVPYVALMGNHDCLGSGRRIFSKVFGDPNFAFTAGNVRFVCLNTNALEYDYSVPVPDFDFIRSQLDRPASHEDKTVVAMHIKPYSLEFNNSVAPIFQYYLNSFNGLQFCLNAHGHNLSVDDLFDDGVLYYGCENIEKRSYMIFTVNPDNSYDHEVVRF